MTESSAQITIVNFPGTRMVGLEHRGRPQLISETWEKLMPIAGPAGLFRPDKRTISLYCCGDPSVKPEDMVSYAGMEYADDAVIPGELTHKEIPAGEYVTYLHKGPYEGLSAAWEKVVNEAEAATGRKLGTSDAFEIYLNDPGSTPPEEWLTQLYVPVV